MVSVTQTLAQRSERSHARKMPLSVVNVKERIPETDGDVSRLREELRRSEEKAKKVRASALPRRAGLPSKGVTCPRHHRGVEARGKAI